MEQFIDQLLGEHTFAIWVAGILWAFIGIAAFKLWSVWKAKNKDPKFKFSFKTWFNENTIDFMIGVVVALIVLRMGDYSFQLAAKFGYDWGRSEDFVAAMIPISAFIQWRLDKARIKISK